MHISGSEWKYGDNAPSTVAVTVDMSFVDVVFSGSSSDRDFDAVPEVPSADPVPPELEEHPPTSNATASTTPVTDVHDFAPTTVQHPT
ncbi:hypothetical protein GCM10027169_28220 [Gordonia jinhuaensis]|uniref:Uncharacterized protein n=1 Tax=Gordonia jinhuaensis TaxID=1517702 RepID=A0A916T9G9_9ACTN|nr:hypothetical protein GCM10011489_25910 [Gordonia jinhuaensis]